MTKTVVPMPMSGFCAHPSATENSHQWCQKTGCPCECHTKGEHE